MRRGRREVCRTRRRGHATTGYWVPVENARRVPVVEVFRREGIRLRRAGREFVARCPFHADHRPSLYVSPAKGVWHCFACGARGDGITFLMRLKSYSFAEAVREVAS